MRKTFVRLKEMMCVCVSHTNKCQGCRFKRINVKALAERLTNTRPSNNQ